MSVDPRLASVEFLTMAILLARKRQHALADSCAVVWLGMDGRPENPADAGRSTSGIYLPRKCASVEEWASSPLIQGMRAGLAQGEAYGA